MKSPQQNNSHHTPIPLTKGRVFVVVGRWILVAACAGFAIIAPAPALVSCAVLSFLLVNALLQHLPFKASCFAAFTVSTLFGGPFVLRAADPAGWLMALAGAALGTAIAYSLIPKIDRLINAPQK